MSVPPQDRHQRAVARSLALAQESADAGDYRDALLWVQTVESVAGRLSEDWQAKARAWADAAREAEPHPADTIAPGAPLT